MAKASTTAPPDEAQRILTDVIEYLSEKILVDEQNRLENWQTLEYFYTKLDKSYNHGRLFARLRLAKIVAAVGHTDPYQTENIASGTLMSLLSPALPLVKWTDRHWKDLESLLESTRNVLLREDVTSSLLLKDAEESDKISQVRAESDLYTLKVDSLLRYIRVNRALCGFRDVIEEQLDQKDGSLKMDPTVLAEFSQRLERDYANDEHVRKALEALLIRGSGRSTRSHGVALKSRTELRMLLNQRPFDLHHLSHKILSLMQRWTRDLFEGTPTLTRLGYQPMRMTGVAEAQTTMEEQDEEEEQEEQVNDIPATQPPMDPIVEEEEEDDIPVGDDDDDEELAKKPDSQSDQENEVPSLRKQAAARRPKRKRDDPSTTGEPGDANVERLKTARRNLKADGKDPMEEIQAIAATAKPGPKKGTLYGKKPSAKHITFEDSDDDEDEGVHLSELPARAQIASAKKKPTPLSPEPRGPNERLRFTDEEKRAIKEGILRYGVGQWSQIKAEYGLILRNRTNVNIKDCYRTMVKRGELK